MMYLEYLDWLERVYKKADGVFKNVYTAAFLILWFGVVTWLQ